MKIELFAFQQQAVRNLRDELRTSKYRLPDAIFIWLSDSPELNQQSGNKFYFNSNVNSSQLVTIDDETFNRRILKDGKIYFLNTQKLGKSSNLTK